MEIAEVINQIAKRVLDGTPGPHIYTDATSYNISYINPPMEFRRAIYNALLTNLTVDAKKIENTLMYMILISDSKEEYEHTCYFVKDALRRPGVKEIALHTDMWVLWAKKIYKHDVNLGTFIEKLNQEQEANQEA
jgi:hypothetical protein